ncbi:hypothetical protein RDWZM_010147 [Blomia tropicalis]|uniref:Uncharacterized protein n=1 Tax=Blomia tropicalis TaxID=40697 RepID=A0A9Q0LYM3_BLOTA|nr:hypothetical protein RDWZM_010147 [Blomia tropicalis]
MYSQLIILSIIFIESSFGGGGDGCPPQLSGCECGIRPYGTSGRPTYVTNCTNQQFNQSAEQYMRHVPIETEVLLMVGNLFPQLSRNLLNQSERYDKLYMVDLSRNGIETIHGQAFHNMRSVQILHLDHNNLSISDQHSKQTIHPRIFSPLKSLEELHLRNTFSKTRYLNNSIELINSLTDLFHSTNLSLTLKLLNLESNHLTSLGSEQFFCQLSSIQRIRLADNLLTTYPINSSCLRWLSSIDLSSNMIVSMDQHSIDLIGSSGMERIGSLHVDLSDNPFRCDCSLLPFFRYIRNITSATVDIRHVPKIEHVQRFRCSHQSTVSIDIKENILMISLNWISIVHRRQRQQRHQHR